MDVVRIWKDPEFRRRLSAAERSAVPASPAGEVELAEGSLYGISGGARAGAFPNFPTQTCLTCTRACPTRGCTVTCPPVTASITCLITRTAPC
ncbi:MAG TPA: mersacidin/lichenicidin family type 2 lantibiotic [Actinomycetota bacterium]|nr:mersacidin/lichenicidin family type 2 lantibiotic [Actinomycetota bacterium]